MKGGQPSEEGQKYSWPSALGSPLHGGVGWGLMVVVGFVVRLQLR
jgi:hypothetical protein